MPKLESQQEETEALGEARKITRNIEALEKAGAKVMSNREMRENREKLADMIHEFQKKASKILEERGGGADYAFGEALAELGYK